MRFVQIERIDEFNGVDGGLEVVLSRIVNGHLGSCNCDICFVFFTSLIGIGSKADLDDRALLCSSGARTPAERTYTFSIDLGTVRLLPRAHWIAQASIVLLAAGALGRRDSNATRVTVRNTRASNVCHTVGAAFDAHCAHFVIARIAPLVV